MLEPAPSLQASIDDRPASPIMPAVVNPWTRRRFLASAAALMAGGLPLLGAPSDIPYTVRRGDTLSGIALRHGTTVATLKRANGLRSDRILVGQTLMIPRPAVNSLAAVREATRAVNLDRDKWRFIVAHHSAIVAGNAEIYDRNHRRRGMRNGLAYHFVIGNGRDSGEGEIEVGSRWLEQLDGGHVRSYAVNRTGIGICLVGNFEQTRPSPKQIAAFEALVDYLGRDLLRGRFKFTVHKEVDRNHTVCPGRHFPLAAMHRRFG
ncbi:MAG: LysM peptidoglycan-binding domain-containing protein [Opitutales bacterium]